MEDGGDGRRGRVRESLCLLESARARTLGRSRSRYHLSLSLWLRIIALIYLDGVNAAYISKMGSECS